MKMLYLTPLLLAFSIGHAIAGTPINLSRDVRPNAHININNVKGEVTVTTWDRNTVQVSGTLGDGARPLELGGDDREVDIKVEANGKNGFFNWDSDTRMQGTVLNVRVPRSVDVDINVVSAPLSIDGLDGGRVSINTVSGKVRANVRTPKIEVQSVSGSIDLSGRATKAELQTVSGDITAPSVVESVEAQTVSGRMTIGGGPWREASFSTVSGDILINGGPAPGGKLDVDAMSGDVQLQLPANTGSRLNVSTFSGEIRSDFGTPSRDEDGPGKELKTTIGDGSGYVHLESFSGDIRVRKQDR
ncbi:DUF4097 and DUF4098 domain-containing protein YvlB [Luteibacter sp. Sphag1AF]|uniref:DUF4097 family beta strand repeat-containing protein n=1 Tax=Luteibacter sp. Sphag1AF TaxID=2587031 RepID=UPI001609B3A4|nr:DUF4097 family beta strand repeat-containing protein [Luteibacter sp. Sphag1AF]MBB3225826.1 DUF4097 and DUF4098 domain-containing protein YvlB [Luteibacter sp. Sphag1AF]